jgi:hypothetical protein
MKNAAGQQTGLPAARGERKKAASAGKAFAAEIVAPMNV